MTTANQRVHYHEAVPDAFRAMLALEE